MFGGQHERQKRFMRCLERPEPVEIHFVRRLRQSRHLAEFMDKKASVNLHRDNPASDGFLLLQQTHTITSLTIRKQDPAVAHRFRS
jgi:hypothetical protein